MGLSKGQGLQRKSGGVDESILNGYVKKDGTKVLSDTNFTIAKSNQLAALPAVGTGASNLPTVATVDAKIAAALGGVGAALDILNGVVI